MGNHPGVGKTATEVFEELRLDLHNLAKSLMAKERQGHTLQPTALLNEAWVKVFAGEESFEGADRSWLIARSALAMQHILTDHARRRDAEKRGGDLRRVPLDDVVDRCVEQGLDALDLKDALSELGKAHPRAALAMTLRFIAGFQVAEIASQLEVSTQTVGTDLKLARAWLRRKLGGDLSDGP